MHGVAMDLSEWNPDNISTHVFVHTKGPLKFEILCMVQSCQNDVAYECYRGWDHIVWQDVTCVFSRSTLWVTALC